MWTDPVQQTSVQEPEQPPAVPELQRFFHQDRVRHAIRRSRTGRAMINSPAPVSQSHLNGTTSWGTPGTGKPVFDDVLTTCSLLFGTPEYALVSSKWNSSNMRLEILYPAYSCIASR